MPELRRAPRQQARRMDPDPRRRARRRVRLPQVPAWGEPTRRVEAKQGARFRAVVDATPRGALQRRQLTKTFGSVEAARAWVSEVRAAVAERGARERDETVAELCERWLRSRTDVREVTVNGYRDQLAPVLRAIRSRAAVDLRPRDIRALIEHLATSGRKRDNGPLSPRSIRAALGALSQALDFGVADETLTRNVTKGVRPPRQTTKVGESLEHWPTTGRGTEARCEALEQFRAHTADDRLGGAWWLSSLGLTRADICGLRWSDVDMEAGTVTVRQGRVALGSSNYAVDDPKSPQRRRTLPVEEVLPGTVGLLRRMRRRQAEDRLRAGSAWRETGLVLVDEVGTPLRPDTYSERFRQLCASASMPKIHLHSLRHTNAFLFIAAGVAPTDAAAWLGHTVETFLGAYLPEGGASGIAAVAAKVGKRSE